MSGIEDNDEQTLNIEFIFITFSVFHIDISGKINNE